MTIRVKYKSGIEKALFVADYSQAKALYKDKNVYAVYSRDYKRI